MTSKTPHKRDPLLLGLTSLFEEDEELNVVTQRDNSDAFLVKFMQEFDPFVTFKRYFKASAKKEDQILAEIKTYYINLVSSGKWTEKKYAKVLVKIFQTNSPMNLASFDRIGLMIEPTATTRRRGRRL